jgi:hypothetical protein
MFEMHKNLVLLAAVLALATSAMAASTMNLYPKHDNYWTGRVMNATAGYSKHNAEMMYGKDPPDDKWQAWMKIDLTKIPDNATVISAVLFYHVISQSNPAPSTQITLVADDPLNAEPDVLWSDITGGQVLSGPLVTDKGWVERDLGSNGVAAVQAALVQDWVAFGIWKWDDTESKGHAKGYQASKFRPYLRVTFAAGDMQVVQIIQPTGEILSGTNVTPQVLVRNNGELELPFRLTLSISDGTNEMYSQYVDLIGLAAGQTSVVSFPDWVADEVGGPRVATATLDMAYDANPLDNYLVQWFKVYKEQQGGGGGGGGGNGGGGGGGGGVHWGWEEMDAVPALPSGRQVKAGGWLAVDNATGKVYVGKGNKTGEFFVYDPVRGRWSQLAAIPGRTPGTGADAVADGQGSVYLLKAGNSLEFWRYNIAANSWEQLPDVPAGPSGLKVKNGAALVHVQQYGLNYVYLLKGPKRDFLRYLAEGRAWETLPEAPAGLVPKWNKGSWLVSDGQGKLYAHKSVAHELWAYDLGTEVWTGPFAGMPFVGSSSRVRKSKDGAAAALKDGALFALKGGNTSEYWTEDLTSGNWTELEQLPQFGTSLRMVRVGPGADFGSYPFGRVLYALKGKRTNEFWRYTMKPEGLDGARGGNYGVTAATLVPANARLEISPNPVSGRAAQLKYALPVAGRATAAVVDGSGRIVARQVYNLGLSGGATLDVNALSAGTYFVRLEAQNFESVGRLVISR